MFNNEMINKAYKKSTTAVVIGAILLALALGLLGYSVINTASSKNNAEHLNDVMWSEGKRENRVAYLDVDNFYQFAVYGDDLGYYIAYDEDWYYIISMKDKLFDELVDKYSNTTGMIRLWGYARAIPEESKEYAIASLQEDYPDKHITMSDFEDIFGDLMLEVKSESSVKGIGSLFALNKYPLIAAGLAGLFGIILLLVGLSQRKSFNVLKSSDIVDQINSPDAKCYEKGSLYLTDDYLVSLSGQVDPVRYEDIVWAYVTNHKTNMIPDYNYLSIRTRNGGQLMCANSSVVGKKNAEATEAMHQEILEELHKKNENIWIGFTDEYRDAYFDMIGANKKK